MPLGSSFLKESSNYNVRKVTDCFHFLSNSNKWGEIYATLKSTNREQNDWCGNSTAQSQAPDDGYINVRNMLST